MTGAGAGAGAGVLFTSDLGLLAAKIEASAVW
jgi:hypothetical protein